MKLVSFKILLGCVAIAAVTVIRLYSAPGGLKWSFATGGAIRSSPALGTNGWILFGSFDGNVYALHPATGALEWRTAVGGQVASSPTVAEDGTIFIGSLSGITALQPGTGAQRWFFKTNEVLSTPSLGANGLVYCTTASGTVLALDGSSGAVRWRTNVFPTFQIPGQYSSPIISGEGAILFGINSTIPDFPSTSSFRAVDGASGAALWKFESVNSFVSTAAIGEDGTIFLGALDKNVYALNPATGTPKWSHLTGDSISSSPAIGPDGTLYVGANDGRLYALDSGTGAEKWKFLTGDTIHSSPATAADGTVYFGSYDKNVYAVDGNTGTLKWSFTTDGLVLSSPLVGPDGTVFIGSYDGKLYALEGSAPLAEGIWPMFKGNARHTGAAADTLPVRLANARVDASGFSVDVLAPPGRNCHLEYKEAFGTGAWMEITSREITNTRETFSDAGATRTGARYYRMRIE